AAIDTWQEVKLLALTAAPVTLTAYLALEAAGVNKLGAVALSVVVAFVTSLKANSAAINSGEAERADRETTPPPPIVKEGER
ncbi:MAG: hypothetical protein AAGA56_14680, partial [Myxococcota bacterium]